MPTANEWTVPKKLKEVTLWVHPEGRVIGSMFVHLNSLRFDGEQQPLEVMNDGKRFVVVQRKQPREIRFYNRSSIVRVEYREPSTQTPPDGAVLQFCQVHLMDGCLIEGTMMKSLPPDRSRLFDFLNEDEDFMKVDLGEDEICLINKAYVVCVATEDDRR